MVKPASFRSLENSVTARPPYCSGNNSDMVAEEHQENINDILGLLTTFCLNNVCVRAALRRTHPNDLHGKALVPSGAAVSPRTRPSHALIPRCCTDMQCHSALHFVYIHVM